MHRHHGPLIVLSLAAAVLVGGCSAATTSGVAATPGIAATSGVAATSGAAATVRQVSPAEAVGMLEDRTVIDVRTAAEFAAGHVASAVNIDVEADDFGERISSLDRGAPYLVYCRSGRRSAIAAETMAKAGFTDVVDAGGLEPLVAAGAPLG
jgi:rhodanese-related sulfurtransferase